MNTRRLIVPILLSLASAGSSQCQAGSSAHSDRILVGILDDAREEMANWKPGVADERLVRLGFERTAAGWRKATSASIPERMTWTVAFNGKTIGQVRSVDPRLASKKETDGVNYLTPVQIIVSPSKEVPSVGSPSERFAPMAMGPTKGRRPLVIVSKPNTADPDGWKRVPKLPQQVEALVRAEFRREFPHVDRCKDEQVVQKDWRFPDSALALVPAYASNKNSYLVEADLDAGDCGYVDDPNDPMSGQWFFISAEGRVKRIGSFMFLLDAGDFDNDGRSELVFAVNQPEDFDGFALYDAELNRCAELIWGYH